jgi:hypothetical protein
MRRLRNAKKHKQTDDPFPSCSSDLLSGFSGGMAERLGRAECQLILRVSLLMMMEHYRQSMHLIVVIARKQ